MKRAMIAMMLVLSAAGTAAGDRAATYRIRFQRPYAAGEKYLIDIVNGEKNAMSATSRGEVIDSRMEQSRVRLEAHCTVLEVTPAGGMKKARYEVYRFGVDRGEGEREILPRKTIVTALHGEEGPVFEVNGGPADEGARAALLKVISGRAGDGRDDAVFGTDAPKGVGDCWQIDAARAAGELAMDGMTVRKEAVKGSMCVEKTLTQDRIPSLMVRGWLEVREFTHPAWKINLSKSNIRIDLAGVFPLDETRKCLDSRLVMNMSMNGTRPASDEGPEVLVEVTFSQELRTRILPR